MKKRQGIFLQLFSTPTKRVIAVSLSLLIVFNAVFPTVSYALTGGDKQPEVSSFEPVGTAEMVDPFSGDFTYNIPLLDVDGYPINISYHSGITMDQEASWVGLGWNINPGVINRGLREVPDDWKGDVVTKELNIRPNRTFGVNGAFGLEIFGKDPKIKIKKGDFGASIGIKYNTYTGVGINHSITVGRSVGNQSAAGGKGKFTGNLGLTISSGSDEGLTIQPQASFSSRVSKLENGNKNIGLKLGVAINSMGGMRELSVSGTSSATGTITDSKNSYRVEGKAETFAGSFDFGTHTYSPEVSMPMKNLSITGKFSFSGALFGSTPGKFTVSGYYSGQELETKTITNPAYGYMNSDEGEFNNKARMDFSRQNDASFTPYTKVLPIANQTYDIFSVMGQGIGGSYRAFRSDIGYVFDPAGYSTSEGFNLGIEPGIGNVFHIGVDLAVNEVNTYSGKWIDDNIPASKLYYKNAALNNDPLHEKSFLKEANEKSVNIGAELFHNLGDDQAMRFDLREISKFNTLAGNFLVSNDGSRFAAPDVNYRTQREKRNQVISFLTRKELEQGFGLNSPHHQSFDAPDHHIAEITALGDGGQRYMYGNAAYNTKQEETTFAVGQKLTGGEETAHLGNCGNGLVEYHPGTDNSIDNDHGLDRYFTNTIMPAYAHSYLLTAVLSPDYVDADNTKGPSDGDLGTWTKFSYSKIDGYKWRTPFEENMASFNEGLKADKNDDKANYIYGEKELWYMDSIVTKNHIAIFYTEARKDGFGVLDKNGGINPDTTQTMRLLRRIALFSRPDFIKNGSNAVPLKEVHFEYDYSLCPNVPNNSDFDPNDLGKPNTGKLTLKKIFFTYQGSNKGRLSPYEFKYDGLNPEYNLKGYDRWGNFKPNDISASCAANAALTTAEFPYVDQDQPSADANASAWTMTEINLPSGGSIKVQYESDDYAYVQNKRAMQMLKIVGTSDSVPDASNDPSNVHIKTTGDISSLSEGDLTSFSEDEKNKVLIFELQPGHTNIDDYFSGVDLLYFRCLMKIFGDRFDWVSGYSKIKNKGPFTVSGSGIVYGWVELEPVKLQDNLSSKSFNPIVKACIQFARLHLSKIINDPPGITGEESVAGEIFSSLLSNITNYLDFFQGGPNRAIYNKGRCREAVMGKSWIRLNNPNHKKLGGGIRVKSIHINDEWNGMTGNQMNSFDYGQEFEYTLTDGTSSGVASYEPKAGGDENVFHEPIFSTEKHLLAPDDEFYVERPLGEAMFPSPSVGYSRVTVQNLKRDHVNRHATGKVVHEFYTSKDFPTLADETDLKYDQDRTNPFSLASLLNIKVRDYMTATQGFVIENNDMNGKPKKQEVFAEDKTVPISSVEYRYKSSPLGNGSFRLKNDAAIIHPDGSVAKGEIGMFFDMVADVRQEVSESNSIATEINNDAFFLGPFFLGFPLFWPSISKERTQFRSGTTTKQIQRFGILEETIAKDLGSTVATKNLAYDAETGEVLLTQTTTDFNDDVFSLKYPAYWHYDQMGMAYRNIGVKFTRNFNTAGVAAIANADRFFSEGDELSVLTNNPNDPKITGWVKEVTPGSITVVNKSGDVISGTKTVKVIRSGRRNMQSLPMATITTLANPLTNFQSNVYEKVLQASAAEFSDKWRTYCDCFGTTQTDPSTNPYVLGIKGNWRLTKNLTHLTPRTQSNFDNNTNIRRDGVFASYTPYYKLGSGKWTIDPRNWTFATEIKEFNPFGGEVEEQDALGRFASQTFGYNQTLVTAQSSNARYKEIGFDGFEDYDYSECVDNHFKFPKTNLSIVNTESHTGRQSVKITSGSPVTMSRQIITCEKDSCNLQVSREIDTGPTLAVIHVRGGNPPYQIDYDVISGNPTVNFNTAFTQINVTGTDWTIEVSVRDSKGCSVVKLFNQPEQQ